MRLIDADKLIEKLSAGLDNPEELPVISIGTVMRMIDAEPEAQPEHDGFYEFLFNVINPNDMEKYIAMYHSKGVKSNE